MNVTINKGITTAIKLVSKKSKTDNSMYCIYLTIETYQHSIKQQSHSISTGLNIPVKNWINSQMTGKNAKTKLINERLNECVTIAKNLLTQLSIKKVTTCSQLQKELKANLRPQITGKAPRGFKTEFISKMKDYDYHLIMTRLIEDRKLSRGRLNGYYRSYSLLMEYFSNELPTMDQLSMDHFESFKKWFIKNFKDLSVNTQTDYLSKIAAVVKYAMKLKVITQSPLPENFRGGWKNADRIVLSETEIMQIMHIDEEQLSLTEKIGKYTILVQVLTGIGYGDLKSINSSHIKYNIEEDKYFIQKNRNKTGIEFKIYLSSMAKHCLDILISLSKNNTQIINIPSIEYANRETYQTIKNLAGITKRLTTYTLRHSYAINYMNNDGRLEDLQKMLGHNDIKTTQIYGKISDKRLSEKMTQLENKSKIHQYKPMLKAV